MNGWVGIDLDGTLAHYDGWKGPEHIGDPIPAMVDVVQQHIRNGHAVKIFTARAYDPSQIPFVKDWLKKHELPDLEVTNVKDFGMFCLYDDRAVQVEKNTGRLISDNQ